MLQKAELFSIFGLRPSFNIDKNALKRAYYSLCRTNHPDIAGSSAHFPEIARAYRTLENDLKRAEYLNKKEIPKMGNEFLAEVLEYEDQIAHNKDQKSLAEIKRMIKKQIDECYRNYFEPAFIAKWRYFVRLINMLEKKEEDAGPRGLQGAGGNSLQV